MNVTDDSTNVSIWSTVTYNRTSNSSAGEDRRSYRNFYEYHASEQLWLIAPPILIIFGTLGNALSVCVLSTKKLRNLTTSLFLIVLAIVDTTVLFTGLLRYWIRHLSNVDIRHLSAVGCKVHVFLVYTSLDVSVWLLMAVTVERFLAVCFPFRVKQLCTIDVAKVTIVTIVAVLSLVNCHFFWTMGDVEYVIGNKTYTQRCTYADVKYYAFMTKIWPWIDFCIFSLIPLTLMLLCNISITVGLGRSYYRRKHLPLQGDHPASDVRMTTMTAMLMALSIVFIVTTVPIAAYLIGQREWTKNADSHTIAKLSLAWAIVNILQYSNNACNFLLYCLSGPRFRKALTEIACVRCFRNKVHPGNTATAGSTTAGVDYPRDQPNSAETCA
ncbi:growth hormone secretagogue receptor type 1-like [Lingula anatina]|uniref:Growth hormone secretagogue receptor type 1-like n=1 Tax=Lingula anatina TaxID=7574 RepID=A0A1S3K5D9_LINAN|nr:growth hormone secretagogue receptor type 1-like [Lingula anatina]|eukprot:XP_013417727.1 growth hormone secretagogue receptor type 1-like [Lingula anatina]